MSNKIDDVLLWMDVPEKDWRRLLVEAYSPYIPGGYWQRAQEGYVWWRQMTIVGRGGSNGGNGPRYEDQERLINIINHFPPRPALRSASFDDDLRPEAGSPEAIAAWSPEAMREYAKSILHEEKLNTARRRPPVLVGQVWAWKSSRGPRLVTTMHGAPFLPDDEPAILLYGPRAPWYGPFDRFTDLPYDPEVFEVGPEIPRVGG